MKWLSQVLYSLSSLSSSRLPDKGSSEGATREAASHRCTAVLYFPTQFYMCRAVHTQMLVGPYRTGYKTCGCAIWSR